MRYSFDFKMTCIEKYKQGIWEETPKGVTKKRFRQTIQEWSKKLESFGIESLMHKKHNKIWTIEEKLELVSKVNAGESISSVANSAGMSMGLLYQWVNRYKLKGYEGLASAKKGRPSKEPLMKKFDKPSELTESEREELIRLRARNEYLEAETAAIKKSMALNHKRWDAQLKAKKQKSSKNFEKKE